MLKKNRWTPTFCAAVALSVMFAFGAAIGVNHVSMAEGTALADGSTTVDSSKTASSDGAKLSVGELRCENLVQPLGLDLATPRLSWVLTSSEKNTVQTAYQLLVADSAGALAMDNANQWDSNWVETDQSIWVPYAGKALASFDRCYWKVRVRDNHGNESAWSEPSFWTVGPLSDADWNTSQWIGYRPEGFSEQPQNAVKDYVKFGSAQWIWYPLEGKNANQDAPLATAVFRKTFELPTDRPIAWAKAIITADDRFTLVVNQPKPAQNAEGQPMANMRPPVGWTPNQLEKDPWRHVQEYDLVDWLQSGSNTVEIIAQNLPLYGGASGNNPAGVVAKIAVGFEDGERVEIQTDSSWQCQAIEENGQPVENAESPEAWKSALSMGNVHINTKPWGVVRAPSQWNWGQDVASPLFRHAFQVADKKIRYASATICGLGYHELSLNGRKVGDHELDPTYTDTDFRTLYVTHEVTDQLTSGNNVLGIQLGNGWFNQHAVEEWDFEQAPWRARPKLRMILRIEYEDGSVETVGSDESWQATCDGPIVLDGIRNGEVYDARREIPSWNAANAQNDGVATAGGEERSSWHAAQRVEAPKGKLVAQKAPPIRVARDIYTQDWKEIKPNVRVYDMGQNMVGRAKIEVYGPRGSRVVMRYSERANSDGTLHRDEIDCYHHQGPFQQEEYILRGSTSLAAETYESHFTYHGFQFVEVTLLPPDDPARRYQDSVDPAMATVGAANMPQLVSLTGRVLHTDFGETGSFTSSNELLNRTQQNTIWSYRSNFVGIPTDCPHREKNGWTGDAQLACEMAMFNFDNAPAYVQWLHSMEDEQGPEGNFTGIVPSNNWGWWAGPAWDSAMIVIPWYLYQYTGDTQPLADHYAAMQRFNDYLYGKRNADGIVDMSLGDWVPAKTVTPQGVTSTGYLYFDTVALSKIAEILGKPEDAAMYAERANTIRESFRKTYLKEDGAVSIGSQTAQSTAIFMGISTDPAEKAKIESKLLDNVKTEGYKIDTGIFGAKYLFRTLSEMGDHEAAYQVAIGREAPGYGAWIEAGATTLWEAWSLEQAWAASLNHVMFGDISGWYYEYLTGIQLAQDPNQPLTLDPKGVAFKKIKLAPRPAGELTWAKGSIRTPYGMLSSQWQIENGTFTYQVAIPVNTTATVVLPYDGGVKEIGSGEYTFTIPVR